MDKKMPKFAKRLLVIVPCAIAALIVVAGCFDIVPAGYKGVKLTMGAVGDTVLNEGLAFKLPFAQRIVHVDARVKNTRWRARPPRAKTCSPSPPTWP